MGHDRTMTARADTDHILAFFDTHPISAAQVLAIVAGERGSLDNLTPEDLYAHDQDHYGGLPANDALQAAADIEADALVLDLCAGLAGPARYLAATRGVRVVAVELNEGRARGAGELTRLTGLGSRVAVVCGDVQRLPLRSHLFDAAVSQEAFLHVPDKRALAGEIARVLKPGGRLAFTDWIAKPALTRDDRDFLWRGIAAADIETVAGYEGLLAEAGFADVTATDLSAAWVPILKARLAMYEGLREEARGPDGADPHAGYVGFYRRFVALVAAGALGGARICGRCSGRPGAG